MKRPDIDEIHNQMLEAYHRGDIRSGADIQTLVEREYLRQMELFEEHEKRRLFPSS